MLRAHYGGATNAGTDEPSGSSSSRASPVGGSSQPRIDRDPASTRSNRSARAAAGSSRVADSRTQFAEDSSRRDRGPRVAKSNVVSLGGGNGGGAGTSGVEGGSIDLGESVKSVGRGRSINFFLAISPLLSCRVSSPMLSECCTLCFPHRTGLPPLCFNLPLPPQIHPTFHPKPTTDTSCQRRRCPGWSRRPTC